MNASKEFKKYTEKVCEQIRWKKAHAVVAKEIEDHLVDQKNAYINMGDPENIAEEKALLQMGDPVAVGAALDSTHKPAPQKGFIILLLLLLGISTILQLQFVPLIAEEWLQEIFTARLYVIPLFAIVTLSIFYHLDFSFFGKYPYLIPALLLVSIFLKETFGIQMNGQKWLSFGSLAISPFLLSLLFPLGLCSIAYQFRQQRLYGYIKTCLFAIFAAILLASFFGFASLFIFAFSATVVLFSASCKGWFGKNTKPVFFTFAIAGLLFTMYLLFGTPYRLNRITYALHPEADPQGYGYIALLLRSMLADSKFFGTASGFAENPILQNLLTDDFCAEYFLTFITYRFGWAVSIALVMLLAVFLVLGFHKCLKQKSVWGQMVSLCILSVFTVECFFYILTNLGHPFIASASLPFLSYGMNNTLIHMALAGTLLSVFRTGEVYRDEEKPVLNESKFIQWTNGKLIISFKG